MTRNILRTASAFALLGLAFASTQCSVIANADLGLGIGVKCTTDSQCQGGICDRGVCASDCTTDGDCPKPSLCLSARCRIGCRQASECTLPGTICDTGLGACRAGCNLDTQCAATEICDQGSLVCKVGCRTANEKIACGAGKICEAEQCVAGCRLDADCGGGTICEAKKCVAGCRPDVAAMKPCASGQYCEPATPATVGVCKPAVQVGAIVAGKTDGSDAWSTSHKIGLDDAVSIKPFVSFKDKRYQLVEDVKKLDVAKTEIGKLATAGANAVAVTSRVGYEAVYADASKHSSVKFLAMGARENKALPNVSSYRTDTDAGWYVMGRIAGRIVAPTTAKCIGLILPQAGRQIVRETNAFIMGARKQAPDAKVVIRWLGANSDPDLASYTFTSASGFYSTTGGVKLTREELLAAQLGDLGCSVIAHHTETQRSVAFIDKSLKAPFKSQFGVPLFSFATDLQHACRINPFDAGSEWRVSCAGSLYWHWGPTYANIFELLKKGTWEPRNEFVRWSAGPDAPFKFLEHENSASVLAISPTDIQTYRIEMQNNPEYVWDPGQHGGIKFVGQRDLDKNGLPDTKQELFSFEEVLSEPNELDRMCWFVSGAYEFPACSSGTGGLGCTATLSSLVPAMVPYGPKMDPAAKDVAGNTCSLRADKCTSTLAPTSTTDIAKYGDVINFIRLSSLAGDPQTAMDCPSN